jgi:hypothetical protein
MTFPGELDDGSALPPVFPCVTPGPRPRFKLPNGLTARQNLFVQEYLRDCNATKAAIRAKYSAKTARSIGSELLHLPHVAAAIAARFAERVRRREAYAVKHAPSAAP